MVEQVEAAQEIAKSEAKKAKKSGKVSAHKVRKKPKGGRPKGKAGGTFRTPVNPRPNPQP